MRVKYRAWHKAEKKMYQVVDMYFGKSGELQTVRLLAEHNNMQYPTNDTSIDEVVLMQYTGINDKNSKEICGGDIVRVSDIEVATIHEVKNYTDEDYPAFDLSPAFDLECNSFSSIANSSEFEIEAIGNIYENPELLK